MNLLNYISNWKITYLSISILSVVISMYLFSISNIGIIFLILSLLFAITIILSIIFVKCDTKWPKTLPGLGGKFIDRKSMLFEICQDDNDCCEAYNMELKCQGSSEKSGIPKICTPAKYNCITDAMGINKCTTGETTVIDKNDPGKPILVGSFGELAANTLPIIGGTGGALLGIKYGKSVDTAVGGGAGGRAFGQQIASMIPGGGEGPTDKDYWTGTGTDFDKITINVSGNYETIQDCRKKCDTTLDSYKNSDFYKCTDIVKDTCKDSLDDIKKCTNCVSQKQNEIFRCHPSGSKPPCSKDEIYCGGGVELAETWCKNINLDSDESIQKMIDCPNKLLDNKICNTSTQLIGDINNCTSCIDENISKIEELECPKDMNERDKINLCNRMSYYYRI
jgi:hypothetical protein